MPTHAFSFQINKLFLICLFFLGSSSDYLAQDSLIIYFGINEHEVNATNKAIIKSFLNQNERTISSVDIQAFCDDTGRESVNYKLSILRAEALGEQFVEQGLEPALITAVRGMGSLPLENPFGDLAQERASLRRATAYVSYVTSQPIPEAPPAPVVEVVKEPLPKKALIRDSVRTGESINLEQVLFVGGTRQILASSKSALQYLVDELRSRPNLSIRIEGHVCCTEPGKDGKDLDTRRNNLSEMRAKAVYDHLVEAGVDKSRLEYVGKKGDFPLGGDVTLNRRVEIVVTKGGSAD